jgi:hypothetical protein
MHGLDVLPAYQSLVHPTTAGEQDPLGSYRARDGTKLHERPHHLLMYSASHNAAREIPQCYLVRPTGTKSHVPLPCFQRHIGSTVATICLEEKKAHIHPWL